MGSESSWRNCTRNIGEPFEIVDEHAKVVINKGVKSFFSRNIDSKGRLIRGIAALLCFVGAAFAFKASPWFGGLLLTSAIFISFEALKGWCVLRACGIKTKL